MELDQAFHLVLNGFKFGCVDWDAGTAGAGNDIDHVEDATGAGDDRR